MRLPQREAPVVRVGPEGQAPKDHWHWPHALPEDRLEAIQERLQVRPIMLIFMSSLILEFSL